MLDVKHRYFFASIGTWSCLWSYKNITFGLGPSNCGKCTLVEACQLSFGEYVGNFNAETLAYRDSKSDEAAVLRWILLLQSKRLIFSNEIKNKSDLDANSI